MWKGGKRLIGKGISLSTHFDSKEHLEILNSYTRLINLKQELFKFQQVSFFCLHTCVHSVETIPGMGHMGDKGK
jgi:hypothetical protein